jgi:hypothetical protein
MKTDYTLTDEYLEAVQVNEGTWLGLDMGRALSPDAQRVYVVHGSGGIHLGKNYLARLYTHGANQDMQAAQRLAAFEAQCVAQQPGDDMLSDEQIQAQVLRNRQQYEQARDVLAAQKAMPKPRILTQQDEQLNMAYQNGFDDGEVLGRMAMLRLVCKLAIVGVAAATLFAFIILG